MSKTNKVSKQKKDKQIEEIKSNSILSYFSILKLKSNIFLDVDEKDHAIVEWIDEDNVFSVKPLDDIFLYDVEDKFKIDEIYDVRYADRLIYKARLKIKGEKF